MRFWRLLPIYGGLVLFGVGWTAGARAAETVYTVGGVDVDVTADTVAQARERAIAQGHLKALSALFDRLVLEEDRSRAPDLSTQEIEGLVLGFSVADERTSDVRYLAELTFRFKPQAARALLVQRGLRFAETQSKPWLVLPLARVDGTTLLWEEGNAWREIWQERRGVGELVPLLAPVGDLADIAAIDAGRAATGDAAALAALAGRYGTERVLLTTAELAGDPDAGTASLAVTDTWLVEGQLVPRGTNSFRQQEGETLAQLQDRAAQASADALASDWRRRNVIEFGVRGVIRASVPIASFAEWLSIRERLARVPLVESATVESLELTKAELSINYFGGEQQLTTALAQHNLLLRRRLPGGWELLPGPATGSQASQ